MKNENLNLSISRADGILGLFSEEVPELGLSEISAMTDTNRSTVTRIVAALQSLGYLSKSEKNLKYRLGGKIGLLAKAYYSSLNFEQIALPYINELRDKTQETVTLSIVKDYHGHYLAWADSPKRIRMVIEDADINFDLHAGAPGKLLLAYQSSDFINTMIDRFGLAQFTENTIINKDTLLAELVKIRDSGFATSRGEHIKNGCTMSAPVRNFSGEVVASLSVTWVGLAADLEKEQSTRELLREVTGKLSTEFGFFEQK